MTDTESGAGNEVGTTNELADLLAANRSVVQEILTASSKEESERKRVLEVEKTLRELVANPNLSDFLKAYALKTGKPGEATLITVPGMIAKTPPEEVPTLKIGSDGKLFMVMNPYNPEGDKNIMEASLMTVRHEEGGMVALKENGPVALAEQVKVGYIGGNRPFKELIPDGTAIVTESDERGHCFLLSDHIRTKEELGFTKATSESMNTKLHSEIRRMGQELAPTPPAPSAPPAQPTT